MRWAWIGLTGLLLAAPADAGRNIRFGDGAWLVSEQGEVLATLPAEERNAFDPATEMVYRLADGHLQATSMRTGKPAWRVACSGPMPPEAILFHAGASRVLMVSKERIRAFEIATGALVFDEGVSGFTLRGDRRYPWRPFMQSVGEALYLVHAKEQHVRSADGSWGGSFAAQRPTVRAIHVPTGETRLAFETTFFGPRELVGDIGPGVYVNRGRDLVAGSLRSREQSVHFFDPQTGKPSAKPTRIREAVLGDKTSVLLLDRTPPQLRAWDATSSTARWTTPGILGALRIVSVTANRVVVDASTHAVVFDARTGAELARLALPDRPTRSRAIPVHDAGSHLLLELAGDDGRVAWTAVDTETWRPGWRRAEGAVLDADAERVVLSAGLKRVHRGKGVTPAVWRREGPALVVLDTQSGKQLLRWSIPGPGESVESVQCHARRTRSGYVVRFHWSAP